MTDGPEVQDGPLAGIVVIDAGQVVAGPSIAAFLGDFGATILKDIWRVQHGQEPVYGARTPWTPRPRYTDGTPKTPREPIQD